MVASTLLRYSASEPTPRSGFAGAMTGYPPRRRRPATESQPLASAKAPCSMTMVGLPGTPARPAVPTDTSDDASLEFAGALALPASPQPASSTAAAAAVATSELIRSRCFTACSVRWCGIARRCLRPYGRGRVRQDANAHERSFVAIHEALKRHADDWARLRSAGGFAAVGRAGLGDEHRAMRSGRLLAWLRARDAPR